MITFDFNTYIKEKNLGKYEDKIKEIKKHFNSDNKLLDWYHIDKCISVEEIEQIKFVSSKVRDICDTFVVIGIGGSFMGAKAVIECLSSYFKKGKPEIIFAGNNLSGEYLMNLLTYLEDKNIIINVISKSGNTLETKVTFGLLYKFMQKKYDDDELKERIIITTDNEEGYLRSLVKEKGFISFNVPREIGGRFSVLSTVGLLPIAVMQKDFIGLLDGARKANIDMAIKYAVIRDILYREGKIIESFTYYEPKMTTFIEWLKQLFAETQGKNKKGILPISCSNTRDLHSLGQFYQEGNPIIFETVFGIKQDYNINTNIKEFTIDNINMIALDKVAKAHFKAGIESNIIYLDKLDAETLGELIYFFEIAAASGAYLLDVYPFDQPGVNEYKKLINEELK